MVFEVQENSDTTFRLYDWDHVDASTGKRRDLQVDEALACVRMDQGAITQVTPAVEETAPVRCERYFDNAHFRLWRMSGSEPFDVGAPGQPRILVCTDGVGHVEYDGGDYAVTRGAVTLLPAALGVCRFRPDGPVTLLQIATPEHP
jgi:mannose-6-phosphate isomerase